MLSLERLVNPEKIALVGLINNQDEGTVLSRNIRTSQIRRSMFRILPSQEHEDNSASIAAINFPHDIDIAMISSSDPNADRYVELCKENAVPFIFLIASSSKPGMQGTASVNLDHAAGPGGSCMVFGPDSAGIFISRSSLNLSLISNDIIRTDMDEAFGLIAVDCSRYSLVIEEFRRFKPGLGFLLDLGNSTGDREFFSALGDYLQKSRNILAVTLLISRNASSGSDTPSSLRLNFRKPLIVYRERIQARKNAEIAPADSGRNGKCTDLEDCVEARDLYDVPDFARGIAFNPAMRGKNVTIISTKSGTESVANDYLKSGAFGMHLNVQTFGSITRTRLAKLLGNGYSGHNPITLDPRQRERIGPAVDAILRDRNTDAILTLVTPDSLDIVSSIISAHDAGRMKKPVMVALLGSGFHDGTLEELSSRRIAVYPSIRRAITAMKALAAYSMMRREEGAQEQVV